MKSIVVASDLSARSDRAVERALQVANEAGAQLTVLHVVDDELPASFAERLKQEAEIALDEQLMALSSKGKASVIRKVVFGNGFRDILDHADGAAADLIVLGVHRNESGRGLFAGTTVERVVRHGEFPVLVVRDRVKGPYAKAMLGVDFSACSRRAAEFALQFLPKAEIVLVHAYDVPFKGLLTGRAVKEEVTKRHQKEFDAMVAGEVKAFLGSLEGGADRLKRVMVEGGVREAIREQVGKLRPDLLIVGTHGRTGVAHAVLGSVAEDMLNEPPCDVLAVKAW